MPTNSSLTSHNSGHASQKSSLSPISLVALAALIRNLEESSNIELRKSMKKAMIKPPSAKKNRKHYGTNYGAIHTRQSNHSIPRGLKPYTGFFKKPIQIGDTTYFQAKENTSDTKKTQLKETKQSPPLLKDELPATNNTVTCQHAARKTTPGTKSLKSFNFEKGKEYNSLDLCFTNIAPCHPQTSLRFDIDTVWSIPPYLPFQRQIYMLAKPSKGEFDIALQLQQLVPKESTTVYSSYDKVTLFEPAVINNANYSICFTNPNRGLEIAIKLTNETTQTLYNLSVHLWNPNDFTNFVYDRDANYIDVTIKDCVDTDVCATETHFTLSSSSDGEQLQPSVITLFTLIVTGFIASRLNRLGNHQMTEETAEQQSQLRM